MTPDISMHTGVGATAWASGSHAPHGRFPRTRGDGGHQDGQAACDRVRQSDGGAGRVAGPRDVHAGGKPHPPRRERPAQ
ncbi:hypothetical protein ACH4VM_27935 [Streptomyces sp. NPDC020792]|uniref:hypothetical protein n=1 Tax=Streptomyces sp. NPDC020792 TaxID=3365089 RepID=UPI0037965E1D